MTRKEKASELFLSGYNCSQSVFTAYCDKFDIDETTALKISAGLGGGVGHQREVCGIVTGSAMVLGSVCAGVADGDDESKQANYALVSEFCDKFRAKHNTIICRELLDDTVGNMFCGDSDKMSFGDYPNRPCLVLLETAVDLLEEYIAEK